jgi:poly(A) polymerase
MMRSEFLDITKLTVDEDVLRLFKVVENHGGVLRFVGGAVRDALRDVKGYDLNLATDLSPDELAEACAEEGYDTQPMGIKQNSLGVKLKNSVVEISSLYKYVDNGEGGVDIEDTDNWEEDASRRDLTINAVYADEKGNVFDYYNGIDDLEKGIVRFIGNPNLRIQEDYLRILRFFRFYSIFGKGEIDSKALAACKANHSGLMKVSIERIRDEFAKILLTPNVIKTIKIIIDNDILGYILPTASHFDCLERLITLVREENLDESALRRLFALYLPDEQLAESFATRFKLSRKHKELFVNWAKYNPPLEHFTNPKILAKMLYELGREFCHHRFILKCAELGEKPDDFQEVLKNIQMLPVPEFPIKGRDIIEAGVKDNRKIGQIIKMLEHLWIESNFRLSKEELLAQVHSDLKEAL